MGQFQVRLNNKKAFSLIELLVVLVLIGIVGMVAIPNVKDFFVERELRAAVFKIASIVNGLKSELDSGKSDPTTNLNYEMAQISMGSDNNGFFINTKLRDSEKFNLYRTHDQNCNTNSPETYWNASSFKSYDYLNFDVFASVFTEFKFSGLKSSGGYNGGYVHCFAKDPERTFDQQNSMMICHKDNMQTSGRACILPTSNNVYPIYLLRFRRTGQVGIEKYDVKTSKWNVISN